MRKRGRPSIADGGYSKYNNPKDCEIERQQTKYSEKEWAELTPDERRWVMIKEQTKKYLKKYRKRKKEEILKKYPPEWFIWKGMIHRCSHFEQWKKSNIKVCDRWLNSFELFYKDMGARPSKKFSLDRYPDSNGNYEPGNVRWATQKQQANNRRSKFDKPEWCEVSRIKVGVSEELWKTMSPDDRRIASCRASRIASSKKIREKMSKIK